jgi:hypothetical protein
LFKSNTGDFCQLLYGDGFRHWRNLFLIHQSKTKSLILKLTIMKKVIFTGLGITLPMLAISLISYGQAATNGLRFADDISSPRNAVSKSANTLNRSDVNSKAVKNFLRSFKNVSNEKWYKVDDATVAKFTSDDIDYRVYYDKKGYWLHTIRTYDEKKMKEDLRHAVRSTYYDYDINLVNEIESPNASATYIVQLVGKTKIMNLRICDGEMEEWQKFEKSK